MSDATQVTIDRAAIEAEVAAAMRGDSLAAVTARFKVTGARYNAKGNARDGNTSFALDVVPLKDENDANSEDNRFEETLWVTYPGRNPEVDGHRVSREEQEKTARILHALFPDRVAFVSKKNEDGTFKSDRQYDAELAPVLVDSMVLAAELKANPAQFTDTYFYASTKPKTSGKGSFFNGIAPTLLAGKSVSDPSTFLAK